ncbi:hypothetical protein [Flavitalea sp.]|nr:hypothetical protein [Flavitalea sp.]
MSNTLFLIYIAGAILGFVILFNVIKARYDRGEITFDVYQAEWKKLS